MFKKLLLLSFFVFSSCTITKEENKFEEKEATIDISAEIEDENEKLKTEIEKLKLEKEVEELKLEKIENEKKDEEITEDEKKEDKEDEKKEVDEIKKEENKKNEEVKNEEVKDNETENEDGKNKEKEEIKADKIDKENKGEVFNEVKIGDSYIQITSPKNDVLKFEEPIFIEGRTSNDCNKIVATANYQEMIEIGKYKNKQDIYTLEKYKKGDTTFRYGLNHEWNNLGVGENNYTLKAYCDNGIEIATVKINFQPDAGAEMGKPVIYLYPQKKQIIKVTPKPENGITIVEPKLDENGSWIVEANPDGKLKDLQDGKIWNYLFWEGFANLQTPKKGFLVSSLDLDDFFTEKLSFLGLKENEIADFKEYWIAKLKKEKTDKAYFLISFISQKQLDKHAPIEIVPKPDTTIRVFFDWKIVDKNFEYEKQILEKAKSRDGFVMIEWGGRLY